MNRMTEITKSKILRLRNNTKETKLKESLGRAKIYLSVVESIERTRQITKDQENWLFENCRLLDY